MLAPCRDGITCFDTGLTCKLRWYLDIEIGILIEYKRPKKTLCFREYVWQRLKTPFFRSSTHLNICSAK